MNERCRGAMAGLLCVGAFTLAACGDSLGPGGDDEGGDTVEGTAHVIVASTTTSGAAAALAGPTAAAPPGRWYLSPDQARITLTRITLVGDGDNVAEDELVDCVPTYDRASLVGDTLLTCPFALRAGEYRGVQIYLDISTEVLFDDPANEIYSDSSTGGFTTTEPAGGAGFVPFTTAGPGGGTEFTLGAYLDQPFEFGDTEGASSDVFLALDMTHTMFGYVNGSGVLALDGSLPIPPVFVIPGVDMEPKQAFYTSTGTADSVYGCPSDCTNDDNESVRLTYSPGADQPYDLFSPQYGAAQPVDPAESEVFPDNCKRGGYLGFDGTRLCWAMPSDCQYTSYTKLCSMELASNRGDTVTIECQNMSTVPPPTSGSTYASGCPAITPDYTQTLTLVAD